jgi:translation elongation factor EF-Tu-like GTPase
VADLPSASESIVVEATICLLATELGGRQSPITKGFRPNHNFGDAENKNMFIGQLELNDGDWLYPGETRDLLISFMRSGNLAEKLSIGAKWRLQEGGHLIGTAQVKRVLGVRNG